MSGIQAPDKETMEACRLYVDNLIKADPFLGKAGGYSSQIGGDYRKNKTWEAE